MSSPDKPPTLQLEAWQCDCGWLVSEDQYLDIIDDMPCPRCGRPYSTFHREKSLPTVKPNTAP